MKIIKVQPTLRHLILSVIALTAMSALAEVTEYNGIYYSIVSSAPKTCAVDTIPGRGKYSGNITIPSTVKLDGETYTVTTILNRAFNGCSDLLSVHLPKTLTGKILDSFRLYDNFYDCPKLTDITVESGNPAYSSINGILYNTDASVLLRCPQAKESMTIPSTVIEISENSFENCDKVTAVDIPTSVKTISSGAFRFCDNLVSVALHDGLETIGEDAFHFCRKLSDITLPSTLKTIGSEAFVTCNFETMHIPASVTSIGGNPFHGTKEFTPLTPTSITVAESNPNYKSVDGVLYDKGGKTLICWPNGKEFTSLLPEIEQIGNYAFCGCQYIENVVLPESTTIIGKEVFSGSKIKTVNIPENVVSIGDAAFEWCGDLMSIEIPDQVTAINPNSFLSCKALTEIWLGKGIEDIKSGAFRFCDGIKEIYSKNSVPPTATASLAFDGVPRTATVYVPMKSVEAYKNAPIWKEFNIVGYVFDKVEGIELDKIEMSLEVGESQQLTATVTPDDAAEKSVAWSSSNENVAIVDQDGNVTAKAQGTAVITATTTDGSDLSASCNVSVTDPAGVDTLYIDEDALVGVFTASGVKVYSGKFSGWNRADKGLYIVRTAEKTFKTIIR